MFQWTVGNRTYQFTAYQITADWSAERGGVYAFTSMAANGRWDVHYVGECAAFAGRLCGHDRWEEARALGATTVHAAVETDANARHALEQSMIEQIHPPLNDHHNALAEALRQPGGGLLRR